MEGCGPASLLCWRLEFLFATLGGACVRVPSTQEPLRDALSSSEAGIIAPRALPVPDTKEARIEDPSQEALVMQPWPYICPLHVFCQTLSIPSRFLPRHPFATSIWPPPLPSGIYVGACIAYRYHLLTSSRKIESVSRRSVPAQRTPPSASISNCRCSPSVIDIQLLSSGRPSGVSASPS